MVIIPQLRSLRQDYLKAQDNLYPYSKFSASVGYIIPYLKSNKKYLNHNFLISLFPTP